MVGDCVNRPSVGDKSLSISMPRTTFPPRPSVLDPAAYDNICESGGVRSTGKVAYLSKLQGCGPDILCAKTTHLAEIAGRARKGLKPVKVLPDEGLGVLVEENNFIKFTAAAFGKSIADFKKQVDRMVSYYEKRSRGEEPTQTERLAVQSFMRARVPARADGSIWLFRHPERRRDPFEGLISEWLGHQLGLLISPAGETRLTVGFWAAHTDDARRPTYRDTSWEFLPLWDWRGKTRPLPRTPAGLGGLEELVAQPPELGRTNRPVTRIRLAPR
jgi:hypothetical protein